jgi:hypothetical protein
MANKHMRRQLASSVIGGANENHREMLSHTHQIGTTKTSIFLVTAKPGRGSLKKTFDRTF